MNGILIAGGDVGSPSFYEEFLDEKSFVVCADGGYRNAQKLGITPDVVIGDFDSCPREEVAAGHIITLPVEKDKTDSQVALEYLLDNSYKHITMIGCTGTRFDHTLANVYLLSLALSRGANAAIIDQHNIIMLTANRLELTRREGYHVSLLPLPHAGGVETQGLYYPVGGRDMELAFPYGVSNEFTAPTAVVTVSDGLLLVILSRD